jgi:hypothetical protein
VSLTAPVRIPIEIERSGARWFRLAVAVGAERIDLSSPVPEELDGPLGLRFHLPGDPQPISCRGRAEEVIVPRNEVTGEDEHAELSALGFLDLDEPTRARLQTYVQERLGLTA